MDVFHEILPDRFVLLLADGTPTPDTIDTLERCLLQAWRSHKPSVWVDCSRLHSLSTVHRELLCQFHQRLLRRGSQLVLNQPTEEVRLVFEQLPATDRPPMMTSASAA